MFRKLDFFRKRIVYGMFNGLLFNGKCDFKLGKI
jgi:hypothetical protein